MHLCVKAEFKVMFSIFVHYCPVNILRLPCSDFNVCEALFLQWICGFQPCIREPKISYVYVQYCKTLSLHLPKKPLLSHMLAFASTDGNVCALLYFFSLITCILQTNLLCVFKIQSNRISPKSFDGSVLFCFSTLQVVAQDMDMYKRVCINSNYG